MTDISSPAGPSSALHTILLRTYTVFHPGPPPVGWLTHAVAEVTANSTHPTGSSTPPSVGLPDNSRAELERLQQDIRDQLTDAVSQGHLNIEYANDILDVLNLELLPRRWQVRLHLAVELEVTATTEEGAFEAAEAVIEVALDDNARPAQVEPVHLEWDGRDQAIPGDLDTDPSRPPYRHHGG
jgi:hypothetical protein